MTTRTETYLTPLAGEPWANLQRADQVWQRLKSGTIDLGGPAGGAGTGQWSVTELGDLPVSVSPQPLGAVDWDVVVCGGTLGIFLAGALVQQGWRVALVEQGVLQGRAQEWNIARSELQVLLDLDLLTPAELEAAIATEFNPMRVAIRGWAPVEIRNVLNLGVRPAVLLATLKACFLAKGGHLLEHSPFTQAVVHPDGVAVTAGRRLTTRLLLDAMGHFSPIVRQARQGERPDSLCLVVGTCASGLPAQVGGDLLATTTPVENHCQYFWESFPAQDGRTTYLFTYVDPQPGRPGLIDLFETYWRLLPGYQGVELEALGVQRALFGFFPSYRRSPLQPQWSRILAVGDSSGLQSPLSFGGFGALLRHLPRLSQGCHDALQTDSLDRADLAILLPYQPNLAVTWLFQEVMRVRLDRPAEPDQVNAILGPVFQAMAAQGDAVLKPFLQDAIQFPALVRSLSAIDPRQLNLVSLLQRVRPAALLDWTRHFLALGLYHGLSQGAPSLGPYLRTPAAQRWLEAVCYGAGQEHKLGRPGTGSPSG